MNETGLILATRDLALRLGATEDEARRYAVPSARELHLLGDRSIEREIRRRRDVLSGYIQLQEERQRRENIHQTIGGWTPFPTLIKFIDADWLKLRGETSE